MRHFNYFAMMAVAIVAMCAADCGSNFAKHGGRVRIGCGEISTSDPADGGSR